MNYILFDDYSWQNLLPLTYTRPVSELRVGILKIREKWEKMLKASTSFLTHSYLSDKFTLKTEKDNILLNGSVLPDEDLIRAIEQLEMGQVLCTEDIILAARTDEVKNLPDGSCFEDFLNIQYDTEFIHIGYPWDIFKNNGHAILSDFKLITSGRKSSKLSSTNTLLEPENIFVEEGASIEAVTLNARSGPIYIGKNSEIMEGSAVRGPFALCEHSKIKLNAKIYGPTTIGPESKAGGEINNSVIIGFSNKSHDGFLGNSVIGEWCNIGADTNNSNLKNNYAEVKMWNYTQEKFISTGLLFCGMIMGDHSKCGINTMFNTGTVVGVSANIFGDGFPRNFIPSFSWGGPQGFTEFKIDKAFEVATEVMIRRDIEFNDIEKGILQSVFEMTRDYRQY